MARPSSHPGAREATHNVSLYPCAGQIPARNKVEPSAGVTFPLPLRREPEGRPEHQQRSPRPNARRLSLSSRSTPACQAASAPMPMASARTRSPVSAAPGGCGDATDRIPSGRPSTSSGRCPSASSGLTFATRPGRAQLHGRWRSFPRPGVVRPLRPAPPAPALRSCISCDQNLRAAFTAGVETPIVHDSTSRDGHARRGLPPPMGDVCHLPHLPQSGISWK